MRQAWAHALLFASLCHKYCRDTFAVLGMTDRLITLASGTGSHSITPSAVFFKAGRSRTRVNWTRDLESCAQPGRLR